MLIMLTRTATQAVSSKRQSGCSPKAVTPPRFDECEGVIEMMGAPMPFARNSEIYGEGEPAEYLYKVVTGTVRTSKILADGRRQIGAFYIAGDLFGLEAGDEHTFSAEAISDTKVVMVKRSAIMATAARDGAVARELWAATGRELRNVQGHVLLLIKSAQERVAGFLLEMAERNRSIDVVELPMSRQDIADYLGLTIETISRTFTQLENSTVIAVPTARRIEIRNRSALNRLNS
jgi:CRP/FNR family transcriptional regulator, nitrogen fixation regulation protein